MTESASGSSVTPVNVLITNNRNANSEPGVIRVQFWDRKDRFRRAAKAWGMLWGIALFCVIMPVIHFFAVPAFLFAGPIVFYFMYTQKDIILGGEGKCPYCHEAVPLVRASYKFPMSDLCSKCQTDLRINPVGETP